MGGVEIVLGDGWEEHVRYLSDLRPHRPADTSLDLLEIYDIIDLVVDGHNLTACIDEEAVFAFVGQLLEDLWGMVTGRAGKAIVEFRRDPYELVLVPDGDQLLISLYSIDRRHQVVQLDRVVDAVTFIDAVSATAEELLAGVLAISDRFSFDPFIRRFSATLSKLRRVKAISFPGRPVVALQAGTRSSSTSTASGVALTLEYDANGHGLSRYDGEHAFDYHAILVPGELRMETLDGSACISKGYPALTVAALLDRARDLLRHLAENTVAMDTRPEMPHLDLEIADRLDCWQLRADTVLAATQPRECVDLLVSISELFVSDLLATNPNLQLNQRFCDLREDVEELRAWIDDLEQSNHYHSDPEEYLERHGEVRPAEDRDASPSFAWPLSDVRALYPSYRWTFEAEQIHFSSVECTRDYVLVPTAERLHCIACRTGAEYWSMGDDDGVPLSSYTLSGHLVAVADENATVRLIDARSGNVLAHDRSTPVGSLIIGGAYYRRHNIMVLADFHGAVTALSVLDGSVVWRHESAHGFLSGVAFEGPLICTLTSPGFVEALNPVDGTSLWKVRLGGVAEHGPYFHQGRVYTVSRDAAGAHTAVHAFLPFTGRAAWQLRIEGSVAAPPDFASNWMLLPIERRGRMAIAGIPIEENQPHVAWMTEMTTAGLDRPTSVVQVDIDGEPHGILRTDCGEVLCFALETGEERWRDRPRSELLFRNLDLSLVRDAVLCVGHQFDFRHTHTGEILHSFGDVLEAPEFFYAEDSLRVVVGERGTNAKDPDYLSGISLSNYLAVVPEDE